MHVIRQNLRHLPVIFATLSLAACVRPPTEFISCIPQTGTTLSLVPMATPPLEIEPDLLLTQNPGLDMVKEAIPIDQVLNRMRYRGPGGIPIYGFVLVVGVPAAKNAAATLPSASIPEWSATVELAQEAEKRVRNNSAITLRNAATSATTGVVAPATTSLATLRQLTLDWYNAEPNIPTVAATVTAATLALEVGIIDYRYREPYLEATVLFRLVDPVTHRLLGRLDQPVHRLLGFVNTTFADEGQRFKEIWRQESERLAVRGLHYFHLNDTVQCM